VIFVGENFPEYQKKVLEILSTFEFKDNQIQGDYIAKVRDTIKGKEGGLAMKFCAFVVKEAETVGKDQAFALKMAFDECEVLKNSQVFLFENMPSFKNFSVLRNESAEAQAIEESKQVREAAVPGKP